MNLLSPSSGYNYSNLKKQTVCCSVLYYGWFPGVWILCADVSEHPVPPSQAGLLIPPIKMEQGFTKRRSIKSRRLDITQNKEYNIQTTAKVVNQGNTRMLLWNTGFYILKYADANEIWRPLRIPFLPAVSFPLVPQHKRRPAQIGCHQPKVTSTSRITRRLNWER